MIFEDMIFGALGEIFDGPHATPTRTDSGPFFLNISSLVDGRLDLEQSDHVSREDFAKWTRRVTPEAGDLLFSYETRLGDAALVPEGLEACLGRRMALLRPDRAKVDPRFLLYLYLSPPFRQLIDRHTIHGATVNRIGLLTMGSWSVSIPVLGEQRAIAQVLGALDDKIAANAALRTITMDLIVQTVRHASKAMAPLIDLVAHHKRSAQPAELGRAPVWHYSLPAFDAGMAPWNDESQSIKSGKFIIDRPCVLVSKLNPRFPRIWDVPTVKDGLMAASTEFLVLSTQHGSSTVLWAAISQPHFSAQLQGKSAGTSGSHQRVRPADLLAVEVPDIRALDSALKSRITALGQRAAVCLEESQTLAALRDALLPQLMSGKLGVQDAEQMVGEVV